MNRIRAPMCALCARLLDRPPHRAVPDPCNRPGGRQCAFRERRHQEVWSLDGHEIADENQKPHAGLDTHLPAGLLPITRLEHRIDSAAERVSAIWRRAKRDCGFAQCGPVGQHRWCLTEHRRNCRSPLRVTRDHQEVGAARHGNDGYPELAAEPLCDCGVRMQPKCKDHVGPRPFDCRVQSSPQESALSRSGDIGVASDAAARDTGSTHRLAPPRCRATDCAPSRPGLTGITTSTRCPASRSAATIRRLNTPRPGCQGKG